MDAFVPIWRSAGLPAETLQQLSQTGHEPVLPSSFAVGTVGTAAQTSLAAAARAAAEIGHYRDGS